MKNILTASTLSVLLLCVGLCFVADDVQGKSYPVELSSDIDVNEVAILSTLDHVPIVDIQHAELIELTLPLAILQPETIVIASTAEHLQRYWRERIFYGTQEGHRRLTEAVPLKIKPLILKSIETEFSLLC